MEKINPEIIIVSLLQVGFETVDPLLYALTISKLHLKENKIFEFKNKEASVGFNKYIEYSSKGVYRVKEGYKLDTDVTPTDSNTRYKVVDSLFTSKRLLRFLSTLDFKDIVSTKMQLYGIQSSDDLPPGLFCEKEINIIKSMQGPRITDETKIYYKGWPIGTVSTLRKGHKEE